MAASDPRAIDFALAPPRPSADTTTSRYSTSTRTSRLSASQAHSETPRTSTEPEAPLADTPKPPPVAHSDAGCVRFERTDDLDPLSGAPAGARTSVNLSALPPPTAAAPRERARPMSTLMFNNPFTAGGSGAPETLAAPSAEKNSAVDEKKSLVQRAHWKQVAFQYTYWFCCIAAIYFVLVGYPLWGGVAYYIWDLTVHHERVDDGFLIFLCIAAFYAIIPLCAPFDGDPPERTQEEQREMAKECALLIPAYKAATIVPETIEAALKVFPPENIFVIANGNSLTPLDNTEDVCNSYGVNHVWSPIGSKIVAQLVGCAVIPQPYILAIDDDCHVPPNLPIRTDLLKNSNAGSVAYLLKSVGEGGGRGNIIQQLQDLEYKLAGAMKNVNGRMSSCTFSHGAMVLWDKKAYEDTFAVHPGFRISEDWFFGHATRELGRPILCTSEVFTETIAPPYFYFAPKGGERGGFGEMTVFKQRFYRWNFFFVTTIWYNLVYILFSWRMPLRAELACKPFVFQELYETVLYLTLPFFTFSSFWASWQQTLIYSGAVVGIYFVVAVIFNCVHLRAKKASVTWQTLACFLPYKFALVLVNTVSVYWTIWQYAKFFAQRHFKVTDDPAVLEVVTEKRDPKTGKTTATRKISIAVAPSTLAALGATGTSIDARASIAAGLGGRKLTAVHRPSVAVGMSGFPVASSEDADTDAGALAVPELPSRKLSIGTAPLNVLGRAEQPVVDADGIPRAPMRRLSVFGAGTAPGAGLPLPGRRMSALPDEEAHAGADVDGRPGRRASRPLSLGTAPALFGLLRRPSAAPASSDEQPPADATAPTSASTRPVSHAPPLGQDQRLVDTIEEESEDEGPAVPVVRRGSSSAV